MHNTEPGYRAAAADKNIKGQDVFISLGAKLP